MKISTLCMLPLLLCLGDSDLTSGQSRVKPAPRRHVLPPVDEAAQDPTFKMFRDRLIAAVKARDGLFVIESSTPEVQGRFKYLAHVPEPNEEEEADWGELERLLALGGAFTTTDGAQEGRREFCAPYTYTVYPTPEKLGKIFPTLAGIDDYPGQEPWVILGEKVPVRSRPSRSARVLGYLSHDLVIMTREVAGGTPPPWQKVVMPDTREGWIASDQVRDPTDYHACFAKIDDRWQITEFGNGRVPVTPLRPPKR